MMAQGVLNELHTELASKLAISVHFHDGEAILSADDTISPSVSHRAYAEIGTLDMSTISGPIR